MLYILLMLNFFRQFNVCLFKTAVSLHLRLLCAVLDIDRRFIVLSCVCDVIRITFTFTVLTVALLL